MKTLLVGTGKMARAYAAVLKALDLDFDIIGRSEAGVAGFEQETGMRARAGGVAVLEGAERGYSHAIIAVGIPELPRVAQEIITLGCPHILLEKPGALYKNDLQSLRDEAQKSGISVFIAYNRRYLSSVIKAREIVAEEGLRSFSFEFTEKLTAKESIKRFGTPKEVEDNWFIANSTHVVDLAFFLGGMPKEIRGFSAVGPLWAPHPSLFSGAGVTQNGVPFSYHANWELPGPWSVTIGTKKSTLVLLPLEQLSVLREGKLERVEVDDALDREFKPGLYRQVESFLRNKSELPALDDQIVNFSWYEQILRRI
ncbi:MAG: Dehydrogenase [Parcubacteria group bacterium GW2011_GWA2_51_10]|nr:MAG: Dehydrogenase [Parcubacteria group bacterium GW2011_GWA2_51_10]